MLKADEIFGTGKNEDVRRVVIAGDALRGLATDARDVQPPAEAEGAIAVAGAVDEVDLRLEAVAPGRQGNRDGEVSRSRLQIGCKLLADAFLCAAHFGRDDNLLCSARAVAHPALPPSPKAWLRFRFLF